MDKSLVGVVIGIGEENGPIRWQGSDISGKTVILSCDEASLAVVMDTGLVVATVTISTMEKKSIGISTMEKKVWCMYHYVDVASSPGSPSSAILISRMTFDPPEEKRRESLVYLGT